MLKIIVEETYSKLVFIGAGEGNEAAYIKSKLPFDSTVVLTDLVVNWLKEHRNVPEKSAKDDIFINSKP